MRHGVTGPPVRRPRRKLVQFHFGPTWTVGFTKARDINNLFARVRVLPLHFWGVGAAVRGRGFSLRGVR